MNRRSHPTAPRVALLVDTATTWGRGIIRGIQDYARKHGPWQLFVEPRSMEEPMHVPVRWQGDGVIARIGRPAMARELRVLGQPVVNVSGIQLADADFPRVTNDLKAAGKMAAAYFLRRGFRNFAYFSLVGLPYVARQQQAYAEVVEHGGTACAVYAVRPRRGVEPDWNLSLARLGAWLKSLPKPVGVLTWNFSSGREVLYACQLVGLLVPEEVAILSGTDDELFCKIVPIPLSGIKVAANQIGYRAAALLDKLMRGGAEPRQPIFIPPVGVATRQSTDTFAVHDEALVRALNFIRANAARAIQVHDVTAHAGLSRRVLERRFMQMLGRTPAQEIRRVHFDRAKELLRETDLPVPDVAAAAGFGSPEYMAYVFKSELNRTPLRYRQEIRSR